MGKSKKKQGNSGGQIANNRKARHDYHIEDKFEAGLALQGWEVKSLRAGKCNLSEGYVLLKDGEAFLFGCRIEPLSSTSTHVHADPMRTRKLLLHKRELGKLFGAVQAQGFTCVPLALYWKGPLVKCEIALAKGKQKFDKRATEKERDWNRQKQRLMRRG